MNLPIELKTRIHDHISNVQKHMGELPIDEQREILQTLETHIYDALESRSNGNPTSEILEAIIAEMDAPESYGSASPLISDQKCALSTPGKRILFFCSIGILSILFIAIWLADPFSSQWMEETPDPLQVSREEVPSNGTVATNAPLPSPLVGKWTALDFVSSISEFDPNQKHYDGDLELKGLEFFMDGRTDKSWWSWQDNQLFHSGDQSTGEVTIITVNNDEYLFMEWMSGDVLNKDRKPGYYVLERELSEPRRAPDHY